MLTISAWARGQNVGIGTSDPQATLHVNGTLRVDSLLENNNSLDVLVRDALGNISYRDFSNVLVNSFTCGDSLVDARDGQRYKTTLIGSQCWMAENLNYTVPSGSWYYDNDSVQYAAIHGRMYSWNTLMDGASATNTAPSGVQGLCPEGWHVPSHTEWQIMVMLTLGGIDQGGHLKSTNSSYWDSPNTNATNYTGFSGRAGGNTNGGSFNPPNIGQYVEYWTSSQKTSSAAWSWTLHYDDGYVSELVNHKYYGLYCRCVKD